VCAIPVGTAVMATIVRFSSWTAGAAAGLRGLRRGGHGIDHVLDQVDHLRGRRRVAQRLHEFLAHQRPGEAGQQLHVLGAAGVRCGDQEGQVGGPVGAPKSTAGDSRANPMVASST